MDALILFPLMFLVMWLLFVRPQQRRVREQQQLLAKLAVGDEVVLASGIIGTVTAVGEDELVVEVASGVHVRVLRGAVSRTISPDEYDDDTDETEDDEPVDLTDDVNGDDRGADDRP